MIQKIDSLEELKKQGLYIIEEVVVQNKILKKIEEKGLSLSDLSRLTGISRQNINCVVKNRMNPGIEFCLKVAFVLNTPVEELFELKTNAWVDKSSSKYLDAVRLEIIDNEDRKSRLAENNYEYFDIKDKVFLTGEEKDTLQKELVSRNLSLKIEELQQEGVEASLKSLKSIAMDALKEEFNERYIKIYQKLGGSFEPYQV